MGEGKGRGLAELVQAIIDFIETLIRKGAEHQHELQDRFTLEWCKAAQSVHPDKNVLCVCTDHEAVFTGYAEGSPAYHDLWVGGLQTVGYHTYIFDEGKLVKRGDGGSINWLWMGNGERWTDGNSTFVKFSPIERVDGRVTVVGWTAIPKPPAPPVRSHPDGVYFVDCKRGSGPHTEYSSGLAYYKNVRDGGNVGQRPDDYVDVIKGHNLDWRVASFAKFNNGTKFYWTICSDADTRQEMSYVGSADNTYNRYGIFKDHKRLLYTVDGWECYTMYWCF